MRSLIFAAAFSLATGLYEDQAGLNDWHLVQVGRVSDSSFLGGSALVCSSEGVVGSLQVSGDLSWRQVFPEQSCLGISALKKRVLTLSAGADGCVVRSLLAATGGIVWENTEVCSSEAPHSVQEGFFLDGDVDGDGSDDAIVLAQNAVHILNGKSGKPIWSWSSGNDVIETVTFRTAVDSSLQLFAVGKDTNGNVFVATLDASKKKAERWVPEGGDQVQSSLVPVGPAEEAKVAWVKDGRLVLHTLSSRKSEKIPLSNKATSIQTLGSEKHLEFVQVNDQVVQITQGNKAEPLNAAGSDFVAGGATVVGNSKAASVVVVSQVGAGKLDVDACGPITQVLWHPVPGGATFTLEFPEEHARNGARGAIQQIFVQGAHVAESGISSVRFLAVFQDHSLVAVQYRLPGPGNEVESSLLYVREEALASVLSIAAVELPAASGQGGIDDEMAEQISNVFSHGNWLSIFLFRLKDQVRALRSFFASSFGQLKHYMDMVISTQGQFLIQAYKGELPRGEKGYSLSSLQSFGFRKGILALSSSGKLFLLDSLDGSVIYGVFDPSYGKAMKMFVTRAHSAGVSHPAEVVLVNMETGVATWRNALTGTLLVKETVDTPISQVLLVSGETLIHHEKASGIFLHGDKQQEEEVSPAGFLVALDQSLQWHTFPKARKEWMTKEKSLLRNTYFLHVNEGVGLTGLSLRADGSTSPVWSQVIPEGHKMLKVQTHAGGQLNNPGIARADGSVLVQYINPNLVLLVTETAQNELIASIVDGVSGKVYKRFSHKQSTGPVHAVLFDNTVVYTYWNDAFKRNEVAVAALFEGVIGKRELNLWNPREESDVGGKTSFSAFDVETPSVMQRTFFSAEAIRSLGVTSTRFGIADRRVLLGLEWGGLNMELRQFLDARRPTGKLSDTDTQEGLVAYFPQLPIVPTFTISYNLTVERINLIQSFPTKLESTTLVVAAGLDLFFARVMPSKGFDVLDEDFSFSLLILLTTGLAVGAVVLGRMVHERQLATSWK